MGGFEALLTALAVNPCHVLFTHPNADAGSHQLLAKLQEFVQQHPQSSWVVPSLGQKRYVAALQLFEAMAGNSSSGVIEAPLLNMPVLNIGNRQAGRLRSGFICDVSTDPSQYPMDLKLCSKLAKERHGQDRAHKSAYPREPRLWTGLKLENNERRDKYIHSKLNK